MNFFFVFIFLSLFSKSYANECYLRTGEYLEELLNKKRGLEIAKVYYFLGRNDLALMYLNDSKEKDFLVKAKLYAKLNQKEKAIEAVKKYIYNEKFDFKFNYFEEIKEVLKLIGINEDIKNLGTFEEIVITYINSEHFEKLFKIFPRRKKEIIKILLKQKNLKYKQERLVFNENLDDIAFYLFNNIKNFYDIEGYFKYFTFLENESVVKLKTVLEEIIYYIFKNDIEQATFIFNKELQKSRTSLEKYMLYMVMQKDFEKEFEFPSDKHFYLYLKELKKRESKRLLEFLDLFLERYEDSKYSVKVLEMKTDFALDKIKFLNEVLEKKFSQKLFDKKLKIFAQQERGKEYKNSLEDLIKKFPIPKYVKMLEDITGNIYSSLKEEKVEETMISKNEGYKKEYEEAIENFNSRNYEKCFGILEKLIDNSTTDYKLINLYLKVCYKLNLKNKIRDINKKYSSIVDWYER